MLVVVYLDGWVVKRGRFSASEKASQIKRPDIDNQPFGGSINKGR